MIRVLHLLSRDTTYQTEHGVSLLTDPANDGFRAIALTIGRGGDFRSAVTAAATLRFGHPGFDLIHTWDPAAFIAAVASGAPVVYSPSEIVKPGTWSWLATAAYPDVNVVSHSNWACTRQVQAGLAGERCHVIMPGIDSCRIPNSGKSALRHDLGVTDSEFVILAPGESFRPARHRMAWHAAAILRELDPRYRLLMWGRGPDARVIRDLSVRVNQPGLTIDAERLLGRKVEFEELLGVADIALVTADSTASLLPIAACAIAGLPIIAVDSVMIRRIFGGKAVSVVPPKDVRTLSQRLLELYENPSAREALGKASQAIALQKFDADRFVAEYAILYETLILHHAHLPQEAAVAPAREVAPATAR
ncbi:MAG TPA: glycosyltransferase [Tepidisphaeraceae bacterium]|jgi:glycosyltransferase involved in cell wall biosynthesis